MSWKYRKQQNERKGRRNEKRENQWESGGGWSIILPPGVLESMCLNPGNLVSLEFAPTSLAKEANGYGPWFQVETGNCEMDIIADEETAELVVPHDLLNDAHIPMDAGLVVQTIPGAILIGDTDPMAAVQAPLLEILSLFGISEKEAKKAIEEGGYYDE